MGFLGTAASSLSDLSLLLLVAAAGVITHAWMRARAGDGTRHRRSILVGVAVAWIFFLSYMLNRLVHIAGGEASAAFPGPESLRVAFWIPLIVVHSAAATVVLGWSIVQVWHGYRHARRIDRTWTMPAERRARHARSGHVFLALWYVTTATGVGVYLALYVLWS